jgi:diacylglycerol kinase family enzyme
MAPAETAEHPQPAERAAGLEARAEALAERMLEQPTLRRRMLVIANPYATTVSDRLKNLVVYALQGRYEVVAIETEARDHATELARRAAEDGYDVVAAFGGDGTINEAAHGLVGTRTALAVLPGGSTNVFCRSLGVPSDVVDATEHLLGVADRFEPRHIDVGRVNGRHFLFSSGLGLDAEVVRDVDARPARKARLREWYFAWATVRAFARTALGQPPLLCVECDGREQEGVTFVVQNADPYTFFGRRPIRVCERTGLTSGSLSGVVLREASVVDYSTLGPRLLYGRASAVGRHRHISALTAFQRATVRAPAGEPCALHVDGDYLGETESAVYEAAPAALTIVA